MDERILQDWYRKRTSTTMAGTLLKSIFSFEYSAVAISALYYFEYTFNLPDAKLFYSLTMGIMYVTSSSAAWFVGRYMDRTRNLRIITIIATVLSIVGNITYTLPLSKWLPIIGRGICGLADSLQPAMAGEFSRCYSKRTLGKVFSIYYGIGALMYSIGPSSPVLLQDVNFQIGSVVFNQYNSIGMVLAGMNVLTLVISYFMVFDLTKEPGYLLYLEKIKLKSHATSTDLFKNSSITISSTCDVFKYNTLLIMIAAGCFLDFFIYQLDPIMNMVALYNFSWDVNKLSVMAFVGSLATSVVMLLVNHKYLKDAHTFYFMYILCFMSAWISMCILIYSGNFISNNEIALKMVLFELFLVSNIFSCFGNNIYGKWLLLSLVSLDCRCFVDSIRHIAVKLCSCLALFTASLVYDYMNVALPILSMVCFGFVSILLAMRNTFFFKLV